MLDKTHANLPNLYPKGKDIKGNQAYLPYNHKFKIPSNNEVTPTSLLVFTDWWVKRPKEITVKCNGIAIGFGTFPVYLRDVCGKNGDDICEYPKHATARLTVPLNGNKLPLAETLDFTIIIDGMLDPANGYVIIKGYKLLGETMSTDEFFARSKAIPFDEEIDVIGIGEEDIVIGGVEDNIEIADATAMVSAPNNNLGGTGEEIVIFESNKPLPDFYPGKNLPHSEPLGVERGSDVDIVVATVVPSKGNDDNILVNEGLLD